MGGQTEGDIVPYRLKQRLKTLGIPVDHTLQRNVLERAVFQVQSKSAEVHIGCHSVRDGAVS